MSLFVRRVRSCSGMVNGKLKIAGTRQKLPGATAPFQWKAGPMVMIDEGWFLDAFGVSICSDGQITRATHIAMLASSGRWSSNSLARKREFRQSRQLDAHVQDLRAKINHFRFIGSHDCLCPSRLVQRDVRVVTIRGGGLRWTCKLRQTTGVGTDGEVVWSWRPVADAKLSA